MANSDNTQGGFTGVYDSSNTTITIDGKPIFGFKAGSDLFQFARDSDNVTVETDSNGDSVASKNNKKSGTVTINLNQTSPANALLVDLCERKADFPIDITSDTEHIYGPHCYIAREPETSGAESASVRAWQIHILKATYETELTYQA